MNTRISDSCRGCSLKDVRLEGKPAEKMNRFFQHRVFSTFAQEEIFGEARQPIILRDDDEGFPAGGHWRGEFWGKLMLGTARVADYTQDPQLMDFIRRECHRVMACQDEDGYLGSYTDKDRVAFTEETARIIDNDPRFGWHCLWNIWNRKYLMWAMMMAAKVTGDREIMDSVIRQMDQLIETMHRQNIPLHASGNDQIMGLASMSLLKPLVLLYEETNNRKYLDFAAEMLPDWDREDGEGPNFFRNAFNGKELWQWYPQAFNWAKSYEMMSCLDGLLEYYRVTGEQRCLDTVVAIHANLAASEMNPLGDVGFVDKFIGASHYPNAASELCDTIHWIRLSYDLFLITGADKYLDYMEIAYFNAFLAGIYREGTWAFFSVRASTRHEPNFQCNCAYNHCCVNNVPRTFMDMASATVTRDKDGVFQVNFYQDATATLDGVTFQIRGNYPVDNTVTVTVSDPAAKVRFRKPGWCPHLDIRHEDAAYTLVFDMAPRIVNRPVDSIAADANDHDAWPYRRYRCAASMYSGDPVLANYRSTMAATMMFGPLVLARARRAGAKEDQLYSPKTVNGLGCSLELTRKDSLFCWAAWTARICKDGQVLAEFPVCDYQSAGDSHFGDPIGNQFSIWI